jgi:hypothetical protein
VTAWANLKRLNLINQAAGNISGRVEKWQIHSFMGKTFFSMLHWQNWLPEPNIIPPIYFHRAS